MLLENGFAKRSADYAAGKVVDESIGVIIGDIFPKNIGLEFPLFW